MADHEEAALEARTTFARNLRRVRRERGLTQEGLSLESGLMQSYLSEIESAKRNVSIDNIGVLAHALGVPIASLFTVSDGGPDGRGPTPAPDRR